MTYEIQTQFIYGWENCWEHDGKPEYFNSVKEAQSALDDFFEEMDSAYFNGEIEDRYDRSDYRIVKLEVVNHA